jgi:hypothetical protein
MLQSDDYYTPSGVARAVAAAALARPEVVCDPSCGSGRLLHAVVERFPTTSVFGLDANRRVVRELSRREPTWQLSVGDITEPTSIAQTNVARAIDRCDLLVMNPPFSMGAEKGVHVLAGDRMIRCSRAMQHVSIAVRHFQPRISVAVLPESALFSELDAEARRYLTTRYDLETVAVNRVDAFAGARARTHVVRLRSRSCDSRSHVRSDANSGGSRRSLELVRGTLQMFRATPGRVPLLHTTDLRLQALAPCASRHVLAARRVTPMAGGRVRGYFALVPRVGLVATAYRPRLLFSRTDVQLSDCLLGMCFHSAADGEVFVSELCAAWGSFREACRGTGAPYITVNRLREWILSHTSFTVES